MNIIAKDIWERVVRKSGGWGLNPTWALIGTEKKFGKLVFEFENGKWGVSFNIYIHNRQDLEIEAQKAIDNHEEFNRIGTELLHEQWNYNPQGPYKWHRISLEFPKLPHLQPLRIPKTIRKSQNSLFGSILPSRWLC